MFLYHTPPWEHRNKLASTPFLKKQTHLREAAYFKLILSFCTTDNVTWEGSTYLFLYCLKTQNTLVFLSTVSKCVVKIKNIIWLDKWQLGINSVLFLKWVPCCIILSFKVGSISSSCTVTLENPLECHKITNKTAKTVGHIFKVFTPPVFTSVFLRKNISMPLFYKTWQANNPNA